MSSAHNTTLGMARGKAKKAPILFYLLPQHDDSRGGLGSHYHRVDTPTTTACNAAPDQKCAFMHGRTVKLLSTQLAPSNSSMGPSCFLLLFRPLSMLTSKKESDGRGLVPDGKRIH
ncbi:hypothetical protein Hamer_G024866 [Homarus americanus]|uniref:Uncharacterized protein n=1 Tax=Homarus americanus TaxID=6706 RepID=A0A8J5MZ26_HOMAM|nr:hypothetical protein Hamer_G024866 [Homarus americanus]